jgi:hypothetical protein
VRPGQAATGLRKRTAEELAIRDAYEAYNEARNRRVIGDDIGAAPRALFDVAYRHGIKYPAESMQRTVTGTNAASYLDPRGGLRAGERLAGIGEDVLNIASIVPFARAGVAALEAPLMARAVTRGIAQGEAADLALRQQWRAYDDARAGYKAREAAWRSSPEGMAAEAKAKAAHEARYGNKGPFPPRPPASYGEESGFPKQPAQPRPAAPQPSRYELAKQKAQESMGLISRNPNPQLFDRPIEAEPLADPANTVRVWHTSPTGDPLPRRLNPLEDFLEIDYSPGRRGNPQRNLLSPGLYTTENRSISGTYGPRRQGHVYPNYERTGSYVPRAYMDETSLYTYGNAPEAFTASYDIRKPISEISELKIGDLLDNGRLSVKPSDFPRPSNWELTTVNRGDLDISKWNFGGKDVSQITILDLLNAAPNEQAARAVVQSLGRPVISSSRVSLKYPLFRSPGGKPSRFALGTEDAPAFLIENSFEPRNSLSPTTPTVNPPSSSILFVRDPQTGQIEMWEPRPYQSLTGNYSEAPFPLNAPYVTKTAVDIPPGQNYFDLPVTRSPEGAIQNVGGMRALDIERMSPDQASKVAESTGSFMRSIGISPNHPEYDDILQRIMKPKASRDEAWMDWKLAQDTIFSITGDPYAKSKWYQWLKNEMGIEVIPHPGGANLGGMMHQAYVFNSPEKLPPSRYIPPRDIESSVSDITSQYMNDYLRATSQMQRAGSSAVPYRLPPGRPAAEFLNQAFAGYMANAMRPRPQNGNSPR